MNTLPSPGRPPAVGDAAALPAGHRVADYRIEKTLGGGGFGITYLARDTNLELPVAIKEYFPGELSVRAPDQSVQVRGAEAAQPFQWGLERFLDEARALASFRHPNIARVLRYFRENGSAYIVMEYESGDPLKRWLAQQPALSLATLLKVIYPLLDGLEAVHKLDFLHRDIKPDNIYIRADGTPVLLDFGAARRTTSGRDLTNIISPGFAPFEQYHSQGRQGPWSDIYALGAVMYWMTTGQKPVESAARVKDDPLPAAMAIGDAAAFGAGILRAIDWALNPDETRRPQNVAELRQALLAAGQAASGVVLAPPGGPASGADSGVLAFADGDRPLSASQPENLRKNVLGTVMSLHLVAYSRHGVDQQLALKERFNELLTKALKGVPQASRILLDTGDGAAACFLGDPEEALQSALLLRGLLMQKYGHMLSVRIGLHLGPIRIVFDVNQRINVVGDGINVAQRIMDFAQPNQIVVSRAYHEVISRITDNASGLFSPLGPHLDKHLRSHDIYAVLDPLSRPTAAVAAPASSSGFENTASLATLSPLTPEAIADIEAELARSIGPLARVLLKKALPRTVGARALRELLAVSIPDPKARDQFLHPKNPQTQPAQTSGRPDSPSRPYPDHSQPRSRPSGPTSGHSAPVSSPWFSAAQLAQLERALSLLIGPLARMILRQEVARHTSLEELRQALARQVDRPADREKFLAATQKLP